MSCWVDGQVLGVPYSGAFGTEGCVRQAGSGGRSRGHHGVSRRVSGRQAAGASQGGAVG